MTLTRKYNEIMSHIQVNEVMRARILARTETTQSANTGVHTPILLRRALTAAACLAVALAGLSVLPRIAPSQPVESPPGLSTAVPNIQELSSAQALSALVGFPLSDLKALPFLVTQSSYTAYGTTLAQIRCEGESQWALFRKSAGTEDNSGDYTAYPAQTTYSLGSLTITLKGEGSQSYVLALWTDGSYSCSLRLSQPLSQEAWDQIISANS